MAVTATDSAKSSLLMGWVMVNDNQEVLIHGQQWYLRGYWG